MTGPDPFGTAAVRERVLAAWAASPARLREDANAEEDFSLGGYRDRVVVELAQNAADAAADAGQPGRLRLSLTASADGLVLAAANTGTPLDAAGVSALASLRASAKRAGPSVGRFGVGFAAVLSVTDDPILLSRNGSVRFSRADTAEVLHGVPGLAEEVRRRDGHVPVLRLPFEAEGEPPHGYSTVVLLPLRDDAAADLVRRLLADVDDALLLALPGLVEVEVEVDGVSRVVHDAASRWDVLSRSGAFADSERRELFADRPTEEAHRPWWQVLWAVPRSPDLVVPQVIHAPTPTDEPLPWPALLLASFPLEPSRRHVAPGPLTDRVVAEAAAAYAELLTQRAAEGQDVLRFVPTGLGAGALDSALRTAVTDALVAAPILRGVEEGSLVRPRDAVVVEEADGTTLATLAPYVGGLVAARSATARTALRQLGVQQLALADLVEALPYAETPAGWAERYAGLAGLAETPEGREALGVLPVPLADGRVVRGARGLLLPASGMAEHTLEDLAAASVRIVHPEAGHDLLARLGAVVATARQILDDPAVRHLVETSPEADDPDRVAETVLGLVQAAVAAGQLEPGDLPWLGELALPDQDDELAPASALALPGSVAATLLDPDEIGLVSAALVEQFGGPAVQAAGVLDGLAVLRADDVDLADPEQALVELDGFTEWAQLAADRGEGAFAGEVLAVADLDVVRPERWADAVQAMASAPQARPALVRPVRVRDLRGTGRDVPSYTAWWLRRELGLDAVCDPGSTLAGLLDPAPEWVARLDDEVRAALGVVQSVADLAPSSAGAVLARLSEVDRGVPLAGLLELWAWLSEVADQVEVEPPARVRAWAGSADLVAAADEVVVIESPMWLQRNDCGPLVIAPAGRGPALADLLDVGLVTERATGVVTSAGVEEPVPAEVAAVLSSSIGRWHRHDRLEVDGVEVTWWVGPGGEPHARDLAGLARALAWSSGRWDQRFLVAALLAEPGGSAQVLDRAFD